MAWFKFHFVELAEAFFSPLGRTRTPGLDHFILYTFMLSTVIAFGANAWQKSQIVQTRADQKFAQNSGSRAELEQNTRDETEENSRRIDNQESRLTVLQDRVTELQVDKATLASQQANTAARLDRLDQEIGNLWWEMLTLLLPLDVGIFYFLISRVRASRASKFTEVGGEG